jgi:hypothetical protein
MIRDGRQTVNRVSGMIGRRAHLARNERIPEPRDRVLLRGIGWMESV